MVTTTSITAVSVSRRNSQLKFSVPECIHSKTGVTLGSAWPATNDRKIGQDSAQEANSAPVVISRGSVWPSALLLKPAIIAATSGKNTIKRICGTGVTPSCGWHRQPR